MNNISPTAEEALADPHVGNSLRFMPGEEFESLLAAGRIKRVDTLGEDMAVAAAEDVDMDEQQRLWREELATIEDDISTLRTVLAAKMRRSAELKRNLGITVWKEVSEDFNQGLKNVKESNVYQSVETKVGQVTKAVTDAPIYQKTTSLIGGLTGNITNKIGQMRHSESFKSIEEKVGSAYENVKGNVVNFYETKVVSRSGSQQSLDEEARSRSGSAVTSPTIPEDKPLA